MAHVPFRARAVVLGWAGCLAVVLSIFIAPGASAEAPLSGVAIPVPAPPIDPALRRGARAIGEASAALADGDLARADASLARARKTRALPDYIDLLAGQILLARGEHTGAAAAARRGGSRHAASPIVGEFSQLLGDALRAAGNEDSARTAWGIALQQLDDPDRKAALRVAILTSHERTGSLEAAIARGDVPTTLVYAEAPLPPSIARALRSPQASVAQGDDLLDRGLAADAIIAYDAALAGVLPAADRDRARLARSHAHFRLRQYEEAIASFAQLLPEPEARFWHARALARSGRPDAAIRNFEAIGRAQDPVYGSWALYLAATLLEDREATRAVALYEGLARTDGSSDHARDALWRLGWAAYRSADFRRARHILADMANRSDPLGALRPRYWTARAAEEAGDVEIGQSELARIAADYPLSYYGWRAAQRLSAARRAATPPRRRARLPTHRSAIEPHRVLRIELLLAADLAEFARAEISAIAGGVRSLSDRKTVARLYVEAGDFHRAQRLVLDAYQEALSRGLQPRNKALWWISWPPAYQETLAAVFPSDSAIEPALVLAIMREESGYRPDVTSSAGARGLLQIMPETGAQIARKRGRTAFDADDLYVPGINIELGTAYLDELSRRFPSRLSAAIGSYNAGPRAVNSWLRGEGKDRDDDVWIEEIPYEQTRSYVKRVLRSLLVYRELYGELFARPQPVAHAHGSE